MGCVLTESSFRDSRQRRRYPVKTSEPKLGWYRWRRSRYTWRRFRHRVRPELPAGRPTRSSPPGTGRAPQRAPLRPRRRRRRPTRGRLSDRRLMRTGIDSECATPAHPHRVCQWRHIHRANITWSSSGSARDRVMAPCRSAAANPPAPLGLSQLSSIRRGVEAQGRCVPRRPVTPTSGSRTPQSRSQPDRGAREPSNRPPLP